MSKPLELTVHPKGHYQWDSNAEQYVLLHGPDKRLTDAELAAMYWMSSSRRERMLGYRDPSGLEEAALDAAKMAAILRFATLPNASDKDY